MMDNASVKPGDPILIHGKTPAVISEVRGGDPLVVNQKIWPNLDKVTLETPPLSCIAKDKPYTASVRIVSADGAVKQTIETSVTSTQDQSVLPDRPLVVGPLYTPNPELAGHPDGKLPGAEAVSCPSAS